MDNLQFSAIPDNKLEDITYFKIPKIELEINDFFFDGTLTEFPKINRLKTNFKVRNFDLKLPEGLIEEPEIKRIFKDLGIRNNSIKIRLLQFDINMINELTGIIEIKIHTPFLKIDINANLVLRQNGTIQPKITFSESKIYINPIALGIRKYIRKWEKKNEKQLKRQGSIITLTFSGDFYNLFKNELHHVFQKN